MENENMEMLKMNKEDLMKITQTRVPVCLCLDTSGSMNTIDSGDATPTGEIVEVDGHRYRVATGGVSRIDRLNEGLKTFLMGISKDQTTRFSAELAIVTFDREARCILPFANASRQTKAPVLKAENAAEGNTYMGEGINLALDLLEKRKQEYKQNGVRYYQPWLVLMTDGEANGTQLEQERAISRINALVQNHKLVILPIAVGSESNHASLQKFSPEWQVAQLNELRYKEFFEFLSSKMIARSNSTDGACIEFLMSDVKPWGKVY